MNVIIIEAFFHLIDVLIYCILGFQIVRLALRVHEQDKDWEKK